MNVEAKDLKKDWKYRYVFHSKLKLSKHKNSTLKPFENKTKFFEEFPSD